MLCSMGTGGVVGKGRKKQERANRRPRTAELRPHPKDFTLPSTTEHLTGRCCCWHQLLIRFAHHFTCPGQVSVPVCVCLRVCVFVVHSYLHCNKTTRRHCNQALTPAFGFLFEQQFALSGIILWQVAEGAAFVARSVYATGKMAPLGAQKGKEKRSLLVEHYCIFYGYLGLILNTFFRTLL